MKKILKILFDFICFIVKMILGLGAIFLLFIWITIVQNNSITVSEYSIKSSKIAKSFDEYKIVQLSDIHSAYFGEEHEKLMSKVEKEEPDIIAITGDLVDANRFDFDAGTSIVKKLIDIAPVYYIYGNHETILNDDPENNEFKLALEELGVVILNNDTVMLTEGGYSINLVGIQDPSTVYKNKRLRQLDSKDEIIEEELRMVTDRVNNDDFTILLSHRPEYFEIYDEYPVDLVLTGHAHGGQFRIPFVGGVYAPNQGFFPKYTDGVHSTDDMDMVISRGLGNSKLPVRIFNTPEIVVVTLKSDRID